MKLPTIQLKSFKKIKMRDFAKERYLALAKTFPIIKEERTHIYIMLILTFITMSLLGLFAISPTLSTIVELNRKLDDSKFVFQALETKKAHLSALHTQYDDLQAVWPVVDAAVPDMPQEAYLLGQLQELARKNNVAVVSIQTFPVELTKHTTNPQTQASYTLSMSVSGEESDLEEFLKQVTQFNRIIRLEAIQMTNDEKRVLTIRIRTYFTP